MTITAAEGYAKSFLAGLQENEAFFLFDKANNTGDKFSAVTAALKNMFDCYATVTSHRAVPDAYYDVPVQTPERGFYKKANALSQKLAGFRTDSGRLFFAVALEKAPELALFITSRFTGNYDYLNNKEVISYLSYKDMPFNRSRRNMFIAGDKPKGLFDTEAVKMFCNDKGGLEPVSYTDAEAVLHTPQDKKFVLRAMILAGVAKDIAARLDKPAYKGRAVELLERMVANYPDILDVPYNREGDKVSRLVFNLDNDSLKTFFNRAVKMKRLDTENGVQTAHYSGYTISPEEVIIRAIQHGNDDVIKMVTQKTADVFTDRKRQVEQIRNTVQIALNNVDCLEPVMNTFIESTNYPQKANIIEDELLPKAYECGAEVYALSFNVFLKQKSEPERNELLNNLEHTYKNQRIADFHSFENTVRRNVLAYNGREY